MKKKIEIKFAPGPCVFASGFFVIGFHGRLENKCGLKFYDYGADPLRGQRSDQKGKAKHE